MLNSRDYDRRRDWKQDTNIDETRLPLLKRIIDETGAKIVLSSTWREDWDIDPDKCSPGGVYINQTLGKYGLAVFDRTPVLSRDATREEEIKHWLAHTVYDIESFVILDDIGMGWESLSDYLVKTNPYHGLGLEEDHVLGAIKILGAK